MKSLLSLRLLSRPLSLSLPHHSFIIFLCLCLNSFLSLLYILLLLLFANTGYYVVCLLIFLFLPVQTSSAAQARKHRIASFGQIDVLVAEFTKPQLDNKRFLEIKFAVFSTKNITLLQQKNSSDSR